MHSQIVSGSAQTYLLITVRKLFSSQSFPFWGILSSRDTQKAFTCDVPLPKWGHIHVFNVGSRNSVTWCIPAASRVLPWLEDGVRSPIWESIVAHGHPNLHFRLLDIHKVLVIFWIKFFWINFLNQKWLKKRHCV